MNRKQTQAQRLRSAVTQVFCDPAPGVIARLSEFSEREWQQNLFWLDASGLALYFVDRLATLGVLGLLPATIVVRLQQNLADNRQRTEALFAEAVGINRAFQLKDLCFANLKGITLFPDSVPDPALRCQADLDFLVAEDHAPPARRILESLGYTLKAISGNTWEFWAGSFVVPSMEDHYKARPQRTVELHLLPATDVAKDGRLRRVRHRAFRGIVMPSLSAADLFLFQTLHLFKHISLDLARFGWVLEYWRHVVTRRDDAAFWREVEELAQGDPGAPIAIGAVTLLATQFFGDFAPEELCRWTIERLPPSIRLWIEMYGRRVVLADFPGNKLYLLLQPELKPEHGGDKAFLRRRLVPLRLPPGITNGEEGEGLPRRLARYRVEVGFVFFRLRFHVVEGLRYALEFFRWRRRVAGLTQ